MADEFENKLGRLLSDPDMMKSISEMAAKFTTEKSDNTDTLPDIASLSNIANSLKYDDDNRIRLLNALRPYMSEKRSSNMDTAIKILKLTKITSLL